MSIDSVVTIYRSATANFYAARKIGTAKSIGELKALSDGSRLNFFKFDVLLL